jgi:transcriptional regulator of acetoin/glycerol metabolism
MVPELRLDKLERMAITQALELAGGNCTKAAKLLGISRSTVHRKRREYARADAAAKSTEVTP